MEQTEDKKPFLLQVRRKKMWFKNERVKNKTVLPRRGIFNKSCDRQQFSQRDLEKYSTFFEYVSSKVLTDDRLLLPYRSFTVNKKKKYLKRKSAIPFDEKYKIVTADFQKRLYIEDFPDDIITIKTIDKEFFDVVKPKNNWHNSLYKTLKPDLNALLRVKQEIGYRNDCVLKIEIERKREILKYESCVASFTKHLKYFDEFIAKDYRDSMVVLTEAEKGERKLLEKQAELLNLANRKCLLMASLTNLDYKYSVQQKYARFLYFLSPSTWRAHHRDFAQSFEIETMGFDLSDGDELDTFDMMLEKLQKMLYLDPIVKPVLYFKHPTDLLDMFDGIAKQQLWSMVRSAAVAHNVPKFKAHVEKAKEDIVKDTAFLANLVNRFKIMKENSEHQISYLETKFYKILYGLFYKSVGTTEVLKLFIDLTFCYEKIYNNVPVHLDMFNMAKAIEGSYLRLSKDLEALQSTKVLETIKQAAGKSEDRRMRRAILARQNLQRFEIMEKKLLAAFSPAASKKDRVTPKRSELLNNMRTRCQSKAGSRKTFRLTDAEREYLVMFTDWSPDEDPAQYLKSYTKENQ